MAAHVSRPWGTYAGRLKSQEVSPATMAPLPTCCQLLCRPLFSRFVSSHVSRSCTASCFMSCDPAGAGRIRVRKGTHHMLHETQSPSPPAISRVFCAVAPPCDASCIAWGACGAPSPPETHAAEHLRAVCTRLKGACKQLRLKFKFSSSLAWQSRHIARHVHYVYSIS